MNNRLRKTVSTAIAAGLVLSFLTIVPILTAAPVQARDSTIDRSDRIERFTFIDKTAEAHWLIVDEKQQSFSEVQITLADSVSKPEELFTESYVFVVISQYEPVEVCEGIGDEEECYLDHELVRDFFGVTNLDSSDFRISNSLRTASTQHIEVPGFDSVANRDMTVFIDASWIAGGNVIRSNQVFSASDESSKFMLKMMGVSRDATATAQITGDIELKLDQGQYTFASITKVKDGQMYIIKGN